MTDKEFGYEFYVWRPIYLNGKFSHNLSRREIIHAWTEEQARAIIQLAGEEITQVDDSLTIKAGKEYIYSVRCLGCVTYKRIVEYVKESAEEVSDERG